MKAKSKRGPAGGVKSKPVKSFTIDRKKWINGESARRLVAAGRSDEASSNLRTVEGLMCCLGFYAQACGVRTAKLTECATPYFLQSEDSTKLKSSLGSNSWTVQELVTANDCEGVPAEDIEKKVKSLFKSVGVTVKYTGEYPRFRKRAT
jgi:hypothetical protein